MPDDTPTHVASDNDGSRPVGEPQNLRSDDSTITIETAKVVFHDDSDTPVDFVLHLLVTQLRLSESLARAVVRQVQERGHAMVAQIPASEAADYNRALANAIEKAGFNLKYEIQ